MKKTIALLIIASFFGLIGCNSINLKEYNGKPLSIAIIGEIPKIGENNIEFKEIGFSDMQSNDTLEKYDAIFITKDNLEEAANKKYINIYKNASIPFFFIENEKGHIPYTIENLSYEDIPNGNSKYYITGLVFNGDETFKTYGYGLYNDIKNEKNIKDVYSRVFTTISEISKI